MEISKKTTQPARHAMDVAGSAVAIASLGLHICQGLLSYYDDWKGYNADISNTYDSVDDLSRTLALLKASLDSDELDEERKDRVKRCLYLCEENLVNLLEKSQKLRKYGQPEELRQKAWAELQRASYPFRASTLAKLREVVADMRERLKLAVQVLQLGASTASQRTLKSIAADTSNIINRTVAIETSVTHISTQNQQILDLHQGDQFKRIIDWLSPPDPWINHASARQHHEPHTGLWFLRSAQYQKWKGGHTRHLWLNGKAGCGKTVLGSTAIEDTRLYCENAANAALAVFYFSFSDGRKQSFESLLLSLVAQLGWKGPGRSMLQREYDKPNRSLPGPAALEEILISSIGQYNEVFLALDALDECPESEEARWSMLDGLERLSEKAPNLKILATSRELLDIHNRMDLLGADVVPISTRSVDIDIERYVESELSRDRKLSRLDGHLKTLIKKTFAEKADGMFRWAYCQLQELKKLKSTKPKFVQAALLSLPVTLDATYERILTGIDEMLRNEAIVLLRWLAYAQSPPTLGELAEATIVDPTDAGGVDIENRGGIEDTLVILSGLITLESAKHNDKDSNNSEDEDKDAESEVSEREGTGTSIASPAARIGRYTKVKLAHFSIKEYLESKRILLGDAKDFRLETAREQNFLAQSCLTYLIHYSTSDEKSSAIGDLVAFPLLRYAAHSWFYHSGFQESAKVDREIYLLSSETIKLDWLLVHQPDRTWKDLFHIPANVGSSVYYASFMGLEQVVEMLIERGTDVNAPGGDYGNALQAASLEGHSNVVLMLIQQGADVNAQGGVYNNALQAASLRGHDKIVKVLLARGAEVNAYGGEYGNALQAASRGGYAKVVKILLEWGADVNSQGGQYGNALQAASWKGHEMLVEMLLGWGADINAPGGQYGSALQAASWGGYVSVVKMLIERGADVDTEGGLYGNALQAASWRDNEKAVKILIDAGADVNAQGGRFGNALQAASFGGHENVVRLLLERRADIHARGDLYGNALQEASIGGHEKVVSMLIERGADVDAEGGLYGNILQGASLSGNEKVVRVLIDAGADVNAKAGVYGNALCASSYEGHFGVVHTLIEAGADVNAQGGVYDNALQAACLGGHLEVVRFLIERGASVNQGQSDKALHVACREGRLEIVELLLANGADINHITESGSALQAARERGHDSIIALLVESGAFESEASHLEDLYDHNSDITVEAIRPLRAQDLEPDQLDKSEEKDSVTALTETNSVSSHMQYSIVSGPTATTATSYTYDHKSIPAQSTTLNRLSDFQSPLQEVSGTGNNTLAIPASDPALDLEAVLKTGSLRAVHSMLETHFGTLASGTWTWLNELADLGYDKLEMAELLLEQHQQSPWIHFKSWILESKLPDSQFHINGCVHSDLDKRHSLVQSNIANVSRTLVDTPTLRRTIASLCGLAGVLPNSPNQSEWNGAVEFTRFSEALVRYNFDNADLAMLLVRVKRAVAGVCTAMATVQEAKGCCNRTTALCMSSERSTVELNSVHLRDVVQFYEALEVANVDEMQSLQACTKAARTILQCVHTPGAGSTTAEIFAADDSDCLHVCALAAQFVSLAVVAYSQAHCGPFEPFFLEQEVTTFNLLGTLVSTDYNIYIRVTTERLTCLNDMLNCPVMVFSLSTITQSTTDRLSVCASADDILDTWGPGGTTKSSTTNDIDIITSVNLRGGLIYAVGPQRCHWARYEDLNKSWWISDWSRSTRILIGAHISVNNTCPPSEPRCLNVIQGNWLRLGTNAPYWAVQGREASLQAGQYVSVTFNTVWDKIPGTSLKEKLLDDLKHASEYSSFLNAPCGLRVSFCSGLATRVRMRDVLAELMPIYVKRMPTAPHDWQKLTNVYQIVEKLGSKDVASCESMLQRMSANDLDCFRTFWTLASEIFITLKDTGLHPAGELFVVGLVPSVSSEPIRRINLRAEGSRFWTKALQDTESCATFAYFTLACLQVSGRGCRNTEQRWHGQVLLLQTEVHRQFSWFSTENPPNALILQHGESYLLGGKDVALCAKVIRSTPSADPQLLVKKSMMPHGIIKRYMQKQNGQQYLQERMSPNDNAHHAFMTSSDNATLSFA